MQEGGIDDVAMTRTEIILFTSHILAKRNASNHGCLMSASYWNRHRNKYIRYEATKLAVSTKRDP